MRDLTKEELALAPDWAYLYSITSNNNVRFHDDCMFALCNGSIVSDVASANPTNFNTSPIRKEPFDISKHEWSDEVKDCHILLNSPSWAGDDLQIEIPDANGTYNDGILIKEHAIAIAKHFGLTAEDLK